jgi:hypothetical protein
MRARHTQGLAGIRAVPSKTLVNRARMKVVNIASTNFFRRHCRLDPAIHRLRKTLAKWMDTRVKPAYDAVCVMRRRISLLAFVQASAIAARKFIRVSWGFT